MCAMLNKSFERMAINVNLDKFLERICEKICIEPIDRKAYTDDFNAIRDQIINVMKSKDEVFDYVFAGPSLFGSYGDNLKIGYPDEFDLHLKLKLMYQELIKIEKDPERPGYIRLNFKSLMNKLRNDNSVKSKKIYNRIVQFVEGDYLNREKLNDWFETLMSRSGGPPCMLKGYTLTYTRKGTAHTVVGTTANKQISIDFVAAFVFERNTWIADKPFPYYVKAKEWFAVPKPSGKNYGSERKTSINTFSICAPQVERDLLLNKKNLKKSIRLLKSLRDKTELRYLKSHFIKTIFLLEIEKVSDHFWELKLSEIFVEMLGKVVEYLKTGYLPSYWDRNENLFGAFKPETFAEYKNILEKIYKEFLNYQKDATCSFADVDKYFLIKPKRGQKLNPYY